MEKYSVLMSVYHKEKPEYLKISMQSILSQTVPTDDFVLMCDGPLTEELDAVIAEAQCAYPDVLRVIRLPENRGLPYALNHGLPECRNELVARMDSDDIALPERCEQQLRKFTEDPTLTIVGGAVDEFEESVDNVVSHKQMPETQEQILRYAKLRNPFNHPTVMYRKSAILALGGYPSNHLHEDYALWARLLLSGGQGCNLPQTLCRMRVDSGIYARRGGLSYLKLAAQLRWEFYQLGFCTLWDVVRSLSVLSVVCLIPASVRKAVYRLFLR